MISRQWPASISLALALVGVGVLARGARGGEQGAGDLHLSGSVVVFILPTPADPGEGPAGAFRKVLARARPRLEANEVKVVESRPVLLEHGSLFSRHRKINFRKTQDFVGTVFFRDGHEPQIQRGTETEGELMARAEKYFGFSAPDQPAQRASPPPSPIRKPKAARSQEPGTSRNTSLRC
ncbi:MAG TPA: hypothetical protein VN461_12215 [Vicinamibacteria bacterium]|nr:hypothetical protein [Vicinamibacteria bacterium]